MIRIATLFVALVLPGLASAADVGQWFSQHNGDTVSVRRARSGNYVAHIDTTNGDDTCTFDKEMEEVDEGDLRYNIAGCSLRVLQDSGVISVSVRGCDRFCLGRATLRITRAEKDQSGSH